MNNDSIRIRGQVFMPDGIFRPAEIMIEDRLITDVTTTEEKMTDEENERYIIPGLIDIHMHGCAGYDVCSATVEDLKKIAKYEVSRGITSFCPATMTLDEIRLTEICETVAEAMRQGESDSLLDAVRGIYLEGPFISCDRAGVQDTSYARNPEAALADRLMKAAGGNIKVVTIAPELDGAESFIREYSKKARCSIAHTGAGYDDARRAIEAGAHHITHLYNAMTGMEHRSPGVVAAAIESDDTVVELISDGHHVHPAVIRNTFKIFGDRRVVLISDSTEATGMSDGMYRLGEKAVFKNGGRATLDNGTLAGSACDLFDCFRYAVKIGIPVRDAIFAATRNPAEAIGIYDKTGSIEKGKKADILILSDRLDLLEVVH